MSRLIKAKIDVKKIVKSKLFEGKTCTFLDIDIWINDKPDQYGNDVSIQQQTKKDEQKIYIGSGKTWQKKESDPSKVDDKQGEWQGKKEVAPMSDINELPGANKTPENDELNDLPF